MKKSAFFFLIILCFSCSKYEPSVIPVAKFEPEFNRIAKNEVLKFTNLSKNGSRYLWDFGDGTTSTEYEPTHSYKDYGNYTISLTTISSTNKEDVYPIAINVTTKKLEYIWIKSSTKTTIPSNFLIHIEEIDNIQKEWLLQANGSSGSNIPLPFGGSLSLPDNNIIFSEQNWRIELIENNGIDEGIDENDVILGSNVFNPEHTTDVRDSFGHGLIRVNASPYVVELIYSL